MILFADPIEMGAITEQDARAEETMDSEKKSCEINCVKKIRPTMRDEVY